MNNKVKKNASWIIGIKIVQTLLTLVVTMIMSRYLGPSNFGLISYAAAVVSFFTPIALLGLNEVMVQEIVNNPDDEGEILGTAILTSVASALICMVGVFTFAYIANPGEKTTVLVCVLYSTLLIFQGIELISYWFQAKYKAKYSSLAAFGAYVFASIYKIVLYITGRDIYWFAISYAVEYFVLAVSLIIIFCCVGKTRVSFSFKRAKLLLAKSCYYILPNLMVAILGQTDRVMLKGMLNETATGLYSAAYTCAGIGGFVLTATVDSMRPYIFEGKQESEQLFEDRLKELFCIVIYLSVAKGAVIAVFPKLILRIICGTAYLDAAPTLACMVWYFTFSEIGIIRNIWVLAKGQQKWLLLVNIAGAIANIGLNLLLIPLWGTVGAAVATVLTQFIANIVVTSLIKPIRQSTRIMLESLNPKHLVHTIKVIFNKGDEEHVG